jgi:hypothetical protein
MTKTKTALLSILIACWITGLLSQFPEADSILRYLIISVLLVTLAVLKWDYSRETSKNKIRRRP